MSDMAEHQSSRVLVDSPLVRVFDVICRAPRSGYGVMESSSSEWFQIGLPRRGVFVVERCGEPVVVDTTTALLLGLEDEYRVRHPTSGGDDGTVLAVAPQLLEEVLGGVDGRTARLRPCDRLAICLVTRALSAGDLDQLEAEDATLLLLACLSHAFSRPVAENGCRLGPAQRLRVEQARALLAGSPATRWDLTGLGRALRCSPFHLARQFRATTGETISRYVLRLRLAVALERLAEGERDIAALALATGFSHHSHFSARFRSEFGLTPSQTREILTKHKLEELQRVVAAPS
jgi:AraC family transcriptional regulator